MAETSFGVASIKKGAINATTGLGETFVAVGDIYRDTVNLTVSDGTVTNHFAELKQYPVVNVTELGETIFEFQLLDVAADTLAAYCGGTVTEVSETPDKWNAPTDIPNIEASFEITSKDGRVYTINRGKVMGKYQPNAGRNGVDLLLVRVQVLQPLVDGVAPIQKDDVNDPA